MRQWLRKDISKIFHLNTRVKTNTKTFSTSEEIWQDTMEIFSTFSVRATSSNETTDKLKCERVSVSSVYRVAHAIDALHFDLWWIIAVDAIRKIHFASASAALCAPVNVIKKVLRPFFGFSAPMFFYVVVCSRHNTSEYGHDTTSPCIT